MWVKCVVKSWAHADLETDFFSNCFSKNQTQCDYFKHMVLVVLVLVFCSIVSHSVCMRALTGHNKEKTTKDTENEKYSQQKSSINLLHFSLFSFPWPLLFSSHSLWASCGLFDAALSCRVLARCLRNQMRGSIIPLTPGCPLTTCYFPNNRLLL